MYLQKYVYGGFLLLYVFGFWIVIPSILFNKVNCSLRIKNRLLHSHLRTAVKVSGSQEFRTRGRAVPSVQGLALALRRASHQWFPPRHWWGWSSVRRQKTGYPAGMPEGAPHVYRNSGGAEETLVAGCRAGAILVGFHGTALVWQTAALPPPAVTRPSVRGTERPAP